MHAYLLCICCLVPCCVLCYTVVYLVVLLCTFISCTIMVLYFADCMYQQMQQCSSQWVAEVLSKGYTWNLICVYCVLLCILCTHVCDCALFCLLCTLVYSCMCFPHPLRSRLLFGAYYIDVVHAVLCSIAVQTLFDSNLLKVCTRQCMRCLLLVK